jgi:hypothetical protein
MDPKEDFKLTTIMDAYNNWHSKEEELKRAFYTDRLRLLYNWVYNKEIGVTEFIYLMSRIDHRGGG